MASDWFDRLTVAIGVIILNIMLVVGILQVLNRYVTMPISVYWTYEVARTLLALMTIIAIPYLFKNESDISFLPVLKRITTRTDILLILRNVFMLVLAGVLVWSAYAATLVAGDQGLPMIGWFKVGWGFSLVGISALLLIIMIGIDTRNRVRDIRGDTNV